jgi:hypothetical protein
VAGRFVLHIGAPKSGTTFLQSRLWANRASLLEGGVLLPGQGRFSHTRAASALNSGLSRRRDVWERVATGTSSHGGTVLLSDEWMVKAGRDQIEAVLATLEDREVHVVFTARDLTRQVPAGWQEELKLGHGRSLEEFVGGLSDPERKWSWRTLDPAVVLAEWAVHLPPDRIHLVTVPPSVSHPDLLWHRYAAAVGFDPGLARAVATDPNESLGVVAARFYQEVGPRLRQAVSADSGPWQTQYRWLRRYVGHDVLVPLGGDRIALDRQAHADVRQRSLGSIEQVRDAGWDVVGDLDDLVGSAEPRGRRPDGVTDAELLEVATEVIGRLLHDLKLASEGDDREGPTP